MEILKKQQIFILIVSVLIFSNNSCSQDLDSLLINYEIRETKKIDSVLEISKNLQNYSWTKYIPSVGINYQPIFGQYFISVSYDIRKLSEFAQNNKRNEILISELKERYYNNLFAKINQFKNEIELINKDLELLEIKRKIYKIEVQEFEIEKQKYKENKINLETWLSVQKTMINAEYSIMNKEKSVQIKIKKLINKLK